MGFQFDNSKYWDRCINVAIGFSVKLYKLTVVKAITIGMFCFYFEYNGIGIDSRGCQ